MISLDFFCYLLLEVIVLLHCARVGSYLAFEASFEVVFIKTVTRRTETRMGSCSCMVPLFSVWKGVNVTVVLDKGFNLLFIARAQR